MKAIRYWLPLLALNVWTTTPEAQTIVEKANQAAYYAGEDGRAEVSMVITDAKGHRREREFVILRKNVGEGDQKFYVYFKKPADVHKMAFLVWKNSGPDQEDDRWLWLPALNLARRIAPGDKRAAFAGSDFVYEDVSGRSLKADDHELIETGESSYVIKSTPKPGEKVDFAYYRTWIDRATFLPLKSEYVDDRGQVIRRIEADRVEPIDGHPTVMNSRVFDLVTGSVTELSFSKVQYNLGLKEHLFSERFLRRPPPEVLR